MFTELIQGAKQKLINVSDSRLKDNDADVKSHWMLMFRAELTMPEQNHRTESVESIHRISC